MYIIIAQNMVCIKKLYVMLIIVAIIVSYGFLPTCYVFGASPSFPLQGIDNTHHHWQLEKEAFFGLHSAKNLPQCSIRPNHFPFAAIAAVNYISTDKTLNATLWLDSPFQEPTVSPIVLKSPSLLPSSVPDKHTIPQHTERKGHVISENIRKYAFLIHVDSAYDTGQTYQVEVDWNNTSHIWRRMVTESAPNGLQADNRVLEQKNNYNLFFVPGQNYIDLNLNLSLLSYPSQYSIVAYALELYHEDSIFCKLIDVTDIVHIPPPDFSISISPHSIPLLPGENKTAELLVRSNTNLQSNISFSTEQNPKVKLTFEPKKLYVPPFETSSSTIHLKALDNATANPYISLIAKANISFPITITNWLTGDILTNAGTAPIIKEANFTASLRPQPDLPQQLNNVWSTWGPPISGIVGLTTVILGGVGGWLLKYFHGKRRKKRIQHRNI
jgi:hypothetical protein